MKWITITVLLLGLAGCADSHMVTRQTSAGAILVKSNDLVLVTESKDGQYGSKVYAGSGAMTSRMVAAALAEYPFRVEAISGHMSYEMAIQVGQSKHASHLIYPTILSWEDRATEWSSLPDKVEVKLEIIDLASGSKVDGCLIKGKSGLATFGGDHPQDLLPKPIAEFFASVFNK